MFHLHLTNIIIYALTELEKGNIEPSETIMNWFWTEIKPAIIYYVGIAFLHILY